MLDSILSAFGSTDYTPVETIAGGGKYAADLLKRQRGALPGYDEALARFNTGVAEAAPRVAAERTAARNDLQSLFNTNQAYDPYAGANAYQNNLFSNYKNLASSVPDWTTKNLDLNAFGLGMGGRPSSSYYAPAISRNIAAQLFPAISSGVSTIPQLAGVAEASRSGNTSNLLDIINRRSGTATQGMDLPLAPITARLGVNNAASGALQALNEARKAGIAGWQANPDTLARLGTAFKGVKDDVMSLASMGSGEGGGGEGGGGGGGNAPTTSTGTSGLTGGGAFAYPSTGNWFNG